MGRASPAPTGRGERSADSTAGPTGDGSVDRSDLRPDIAEQIRLAYELMGRGPVAVRSSATAEDGAAASMAGQYETFLHVTDERSLLEAVRCCWASLDSPRTRAYLADRGIDIAQVAMAVVVQRLVAADVAGVLFTANPQSGTRREMLVEASWGLGEAVVSGRVQPDVLRLDCADRPRAGRDDRRQARPHHRRRPRGAAGRGAPPPARRASGRRTWTGCGNSAGGAAEYFGSPQDLEWAIDGAGELYLLQSRPITTLAEAEAYEDLLRTTRAELRDRLAAGRGPWVLHNLAETLPHPTPLTWSVIRRFMTGDGGFGRMYRSVGFEPSEAAKRDGFLDLVAGRVYMDAARGPEMFFEGFPFRYDLEQLRRDPDAGQAPPTVPAGSLAARMRIGRKLAAVNARLREVAADFDAPPARPDHPRRSSSGAGRRRRRDLSALSPAELVDLWHARERRVLEEFAPRLAAPQPDQRHGAGRPAGVSRNELLGRRPRRAVATALVPRRRTAQRSRTRCSTPSPAAIARSPTGSPNTATAPRGSSTWPRPAGANSPSSVTALAAAAAGRDRPGGTPPGRSESVRVASRSAPRRSSRRRIGRSWTGCSRSSGGTCRSARTASIT